MFDLPLISRRPGQKVGGMHSGEVSLPGYCVTWGRLLSFSKPVPSSVTGVDTTCPGMGGDKGLNRLWKINKVLSEARLGRTLTADLPGRCVLWFPWGRSSADAQAGGPPSHKWSLSSFNHI